MPSDRGEGKQARPDGKKHLLVVDPVLNPPGGGPCVAVWALQALREIYSVDLLTWEPVRFDEINRFFGTSLEAREFSCAHAPAWLCALVALDPDPYSFQRVAIMMRLARLRRRRYDLILSFMDEVSFGTRAIQYMHFPYMMRIFGDEQRLIKTPGLLGRCQAAFFKRRPWRLISGFTFEDMSRNHTLVNSRWTGEHVKSAYGIEPTVLYPPVPGDFPDIPWEQRENGFVCIGRISGEKRFETIVEILSSIRARGNPVHLHIIGTFGGQRVGREYYSLVQRLAREHADWVTLEENVSRERLAELVSRHRYGIHAFEEEHFGIAVAEMIRGGCIVFVPNSGGQLEIVGADSRIRYDSIDDAVKKIQRVLEDGEAQRDLQAVLSERAKLFSPDHFMRGLRDYVARCLEQTPPATLKTVLVRPEIKGGTGPSRAAPGHTFPSRPVPVIIVKSPPSFRADIRCHSRRKQWKRLARTLGRSHSFCCSWLARRLSSCAASLPTTRPRRSPRSSRRPHVLLP
ncbi:MAG: glycosyltransferase [Chloroflexi bacterium]|nr:glycosyltransferase [Chloroflexota bacterium]